MSEIILEPYDDLVKALKAISQAPEAGVRVTLPAGSALLSNPLSLKLLVSEAEKMDKKVALTSEDPAAKQLIDGPDENFGFVEGDVGASLRSAKTKDQRPKTKNLIGWLRSLIPEKLRSKKFLPLFFVLCLLFIGFVAVALGFFFLPKATITLTVDSNLLVKTVDLIASSSATVVDRQQRVLPALLLEVEEFATRTAPATGKGVVGEKARGTVTIYNQTDEEQSFSRGAKIKRESLEFLLDSGVSVEAQTVESTTSAEGRRTVTYTAGKTNVSVTAADVGDKYNLGAESEFAVADLAEENVYAKNKEAFAGGSSHEVTTVTAADQQHLLSSLKDELEQKAREDLNLKLSPEQQIPEGVLETAITSENFDKNIGDEAENLNLTLRTKTSALAILRDQFEDLLLDILSDLVPDNHELSEADREISLLDAKREGGDLKITAKIKAFVVPELNQEQIRSDLAGAKLSAAQGYLSSLPNIKSYQINLWPPLPPPLRFLPKRAERIEVVGARE